MASDWRLIYRGCGAAVGGTDNYLPNAAANLSRISRARKLAFRLNKPARLEFELPAGEAAAAAIRPMGIVLGLRKEGSGYVLRFSGFVWDLEDHGDPDSAWTRVVCHDPLMMTTKRLVRNGGSIEYNDDPFWWFERVTFTNEFPSVIIRKLLERTNHRGVSAPPTYGGGLGARTGLETSGGTFQTPAGTEMTITYEGAKISDAIAELCLTKGVDLKVDPFDPGTERTQWDPLAGACGILSVLTKRGVNRPDLKLGWGAGQHNVSAVERQLSCGQLATDVYAYGEPDAAGRPKARTTSSTEAQAWRIHEDLMSFTGITQAAYLNDLTAKAAVLRRNPKELVNSTLQPGTDAREVLPWDDFDLGDTVAEVRAGAALRGGFVGQQRIYGFDLALDDNAVERVEALYTSPEAQ